MIILKLLPHGASSAASAAPADAPKEV
jgi:hypothetical protein